MNDGINYMTSTVAVTALAGNLHTIAMQADSGLRWAFEVPGRRWIPLLLSGQWITAFPKAWYSPTVQRRIMEGMSPAMKYAMQATNLTPSTMIHMIRASFWPVKMFDAAATSLSSAIVYADAIRQGMSKEQALDKMDAAVHRFSQPISLTSKSQLEIASGPGTKMLLMFMADPIIKTAVFTEAIQQMITGQGEGRGMAAQRAFVSLFVLTAASWYLSALYRDWFTEDDDDEIWTWSSYLQMLALVPFQGWAYFGNAAESVIAYTTGGKAYPKETAPVQLASRFTRILKKILEDPQSLVDFSDRKQAMRNMDNIAKVAGFVPGMQWAPILANMMKPVMGAAGNIEKTED
jgi:hypothetical protein